MPKYYITFKAFVRLVKGKNEIMLKTDNCCIKMILFRSIIYENLSNETIKNEKKVRVLYVICSDDPTNGEFQSIKTSENKLENALKRISLNVELLQTFLAEIMYRNFYERKTFHFERDHSIHPNASDLICEPFYTDLSITEALKMPSNEIFIYLAEEIKTKKLYNENSKFIALLSFTRYKPINDPSFNFKDFDMFGNTAGYCALGE